MKNDVALDIFTGVILSFPIILLLFTVSLPVNYGLAVYFVFSGVTGSFLNVASSQNTKEVGEDALPVHSIVWNAISWPVFWTLILGAVLKDPSSK
jgi:hypothetical protein